MGGVLEKEIIDNKLEFLNLNYKAEDEIVVKKLTLKQKVLNILDSKAFHYAIIFLSTIDLILILTEVLLILYTAEGVIQKNGFVTNVENGITIASIFIICIFVSEILTKLVLIGPIYLFNRWNLLDIAVIITASVLEIYALLLSNPYKYGESTHVIEDVTSRGNYHHLAMNLIRRTDGGSHNYDQEAKYNTTTFIIIRLWKFINIIHGVVHLVEMKNKFIVEKTSKEHIKCDEKIKNYSDIIENLTQEMTIKECKITELESLIRHYEKCNSEKNN